MRMRCAAKLGTVRPARLTKIEQIDGRLCEDRDIFLLVLEISVLSGGFKEISVIYIIFEIGV